LLIAFYLAIVCLAEADDPDAGGGFGEHHGVHPARNQAQGRIPYFRIDPPVIDPDQRRFEVEVDNRFEAQSTSGDVGVVLGRIEAYVHGFIVCTLIEAGKTFLYRGSYGR
jgi:hypothetical protein